jgi:PAS domain S-box-containing protein
MSDQPGSRRQDTLHHAVMAADVSADLRRVLDSMPDGVLILDCDWRLTYANTQARRISRIRPEDLNSLTHWELFPATLGTEQERKYRRVMEERVEEEAEFYYPPFAIWIHLRAVPINNGIAIFYQDVTELRTMRAETDALTRQLQQVLDVTSDAVVSLNREWRYVFLNPRAKELLQSGDELLGKNLWENFPGAVYEGSPFVANYYRTMVQREVTIFEAYYPEPLNKWFRLECQPSTDGIVIFFRDITRRKHDEEALRRSEERYRILTELSPEAIWSAMPDGVMDYANSIFREYLGQHLRSGPSGGWFACIAEQDRDEAMVAWLHSVETGNDYAVDARIVRGADGAERWWSLKASAVRDESGEITAWLGIGADRHDQRIFTEALQREKLETERQRAELEVVYDTAPVGLALFEPREFRYLRVNALQAALLGRPVQDLVGQRITDVVEDAPLHLLQRVATGDTIRDYTYSTQLRDASKHRKWVNVNYAPVWSEEGDVRAVTASILDVTQLRKAEEALVRSEKLAAVGRLASSISHEINNPLEAITNLLYLVSTDEMLSASTRDLVHTAQDELIRVSQIATQTLRFHRQANKPTEVTPAQLVDPVLNLYRGRLTNSGIHVEVSYGTVTPILCFENDIRQVLNNLIANAIDAMRTGGRLILRAHDAHHSHLGVPGVRIVIADTGSGMTAETRERLFEAFYTTKDLNGTGLGLWISKDIVDRHRGQLIVRTSQDEVLHGTVFSLFLPCM